MLAAGMLPFDPRGGASMARARSRAAAAGVSALVGSASGVAANLVTDERTWVWIAALAATTLTLMVLQFRLSLATPSAGVRAVGSGTVAAGGSILGDVTIDSSGPPLSFSTSPPAFGVTASGTGSVAAGKDIKGKVRIRTRKR